jgi:ATP-binding cassette subfamily A (ABC1) protein 3
MFNKVYTQMFKGTVAVKQASFGLQYGECFALLGVNGAGKTTTFKCLTNEVKPTGGSVSIGGFNINKQFDKARKLIGFCP